MDFLFKVLALPAPLFLLVAAVPIFLFAVVMHLLQRVFPHVSASNSGQTNSSKMDFKHLDVPAWRVDNHGRPTPHQNSRSISGGY